MMGAAICSRAAVSMLRLESDVKTIKTTIIIKTQIIIKTIGDKLRHKSRL